MTEITTAQELRALDNASPWNIAHVALRMQAADELEALQRSLTTEQMNGQEVHDYLCSVNPDNQYLSVLEAVIQQRGIENSLRTQNQILREVLQTICTTNFLDSETIFQFEQRIHFIAAKALALKP